MTVTATGRDSNRVQELRVTMAAKGSATFVGDSIVVAADSTGGAIRVQIDKRIETPAAYSDRAITEAAARAVTSTDPVGILDNLVDTKTIQSIDVRKFGEGQLGVGALSVIIVHLKPAASQ